MNTVQLSEIQNLIDLKYSKFAFIFSNVNMEAMVQHLFYYEFSIKSVKGKWSSIPTWFKSSFQINAEFQDSHTILKFTYIMQWTTLKQS